MAHEFSWALGVQPIGYRMSLVTLSIAFIMSASRCNRPLTLPYCSLCVPHPVRLTGTGRAHGNAGGSGEMSAKIENDCFDSPRTTISCARLCCASAKEGYSYVFSDAYRPDTVFELRNSNSFELLLYRRPVRGGGAGGAVFGGIRRLNPDFRKPTPLRKSRFEWVGFCFSTVCSPGPPRGFRRTIILRKSKSLSSKRELGMNMQLRWPAFVDRVRPVGHFPGPFGV